MAEVDRLKEEGNVVFKAKKYAKAKETYKKALSLVGEPMCDADRRVVAILYRNIAAVDLSTGDAHDAEAAAVSSTKSDASFPRAWQRLGDAQMAGGKVAEAVTSYEKLCALQPDDAASKQKLAGAREALAALNFSRSAKAGKAGASSSSASAGSGSGSASGKAGKTGGQKEDGAGQALCGNPACRGAMKHTGYDKFGDFAVFTCTRCKWKTDISVMGRKTTAKQQTINDQTWYEENEPAHVRAAAKAREAALDATIDDVFARARGFWSGNSKGDAAMEALLASQMHAARMSSRGDDYDYGDDDDEEEGAFGMSASDIHVQELAVQGDHPYDDDAQAVLDALHGDW